jgi:hypothetical protein
MLRELLSYSGKKKKGPADGLSAQFQGAHGERQTL